MVEEDGQLKGNVFSPQLPAGFEEAKELYKRYAEFRASLKYIADHVAGRGDPMTFALFGGWGTGKTTALQYLRHLIEHRARDSRPGVTFSWYEAPLWARHPHERSTLALQIIRQATQHGTGKPADVAQMLSRILERSDGGRSGTYAQPPAYDLAWSVRLLDVLAAVPHAPPVIEEWLRRYLNECGPVRHVVLIDDLDRCPLDFAARLLKATTYWTLADDKIGANGGNSSQIYFVIASREDFLLDSQRGDESHDAALGVSTAAAARQSLEKYVHVPVTIPQLLTTPEEIGGYLASLTSRLDGLDEQGRGRFRELIEEAGSSYPKGVLAPMVRVEEPVTTPRTIKARLNQALTEIEVKQLEDQTLVKEWVVKAFWPDFWNRYRAIAAQPRATGRHPLTLKGVAGPDSHAAPGAAAYEWIKPLHAIGRRLQDLAALSDRALMEAMRHLAAEVHAEVSDITPQLAIYLASDPIWPPPPEPRDQPGLRFPGPKGTGADGAETEPEASLEEGVPSNPDDQIYFFYLMADRAEDDGRRDDVETALQQVVRIAHQLGAESGRGHTTSSAALIAERMELNELAYTLHHLALQAAPSRFDVMQNFLAFVLNNQVEDDYREAQRVYQVLETEGQDYRKFTTLVLGIRLDITLGGSVPEAAARAKQALDLLKEDPSALNLLEMFKLDPEFIGFDTVREAVKIGVKDSDELGRRVALRNYVMLGFSTNPIHEREVVDFLRWAITTGHACAQGEDLLATFLYSLGLQLASLRYLQAATAVYLEGYRIRATNPLLRRALAPALEGMGLNEEATAALLGRPIGEVELHPEPLTDFLSEADGTDRWWESIPPASEQPCPISASVQWLYVPLGT